MQYRKNPKIPVILRDIQLPNINIPASVKTIKISLVGIFTEVTINIH